MGQLPETVLLLGQTDMPRERIERAPRLKAIFNVETNFLPNIDYVACRDRGIWVLMPDLVVRRSRRRIGARHGDRSWPAVSPPPIARSAPARRNTASHGNEGSFMFTRAPVGIIGSAISAGHSRALLVPFRNPVKVYDPWLPDEVIRTDDCAPVDLDGCCKTSRVIFVFASVTTENQGFIGKRESRWSSPGPASC